MPKKTLKHLFYAQQLNNNGAECIEAGYYDRAISSLQKALRLEDKKKEREAFDSNQNYSDGRMSSENENEVEDDDEKQIICPCYHCTIDGCIQFSEINSTLLSDGSTDDSNPKYFCSNYKRSNRNDEKSSDPGKSYTNGYIYRVPIRIAPQCIHESHHMGSTVFLIITFNLAIAYHLKAAQNSCSNNNEVDNESTTKTYTLIALKLYNHTIKREVELIRNIYYEYNNTRSSSLSSSSILRPSFNSTRFNVILFCNMSQIYGYLNNYEKYQLCLQEMLSAIMLVVEKRTRGGQTPVLTNNNDTDPSQSSSDDHVNNQMGGNLEGFLQNTEPLMEHNHYAGAA